MKTGKLLTDVISYCLQKEEYYSTDLTDDSAEPLSNNFRNGNTLIVRAEMVNTMEASPPATPENFDEDSE